MDNIIIKGYATELVEGEMADVSRITAEILDDEGDVILSDGIDFSTWEKLGKPVTLQHEHEAAALVGKCLWYKDSKNPKGYIAKTRYKEEFFPLVKELKGKSIYAVVDKAREATADDKIKFGERCRRVIEKSSIREFSVCLIPVNPACTQLALSKGLKLSQDSLDLLGYKKPEFNVLAKATSIVSALNYDAIAQRALGRILGTDV